MSEAKSFKQVHYVPFQSRECLLFAFWEYLRFRLIVIPCVFLLMESQTLLNLFSFLSGPASSGFDFCFLLLNPLKEDLWRKVMCEDSVQTCFLKCELKKNLFNNLALYLKVYQNYKTLWKYSNYWCSTKVNTHIFTFMWSTKCKS